MTNFVVAVRSNQDYYVSYLHSFALTKKTTQMRRPWGMRTKTSYGSRYYLPKYSAAVDAWGPSSGLAHTPPDQVRRGIGCPSAWLTHHGVSCTGDVEVRKGYVDVGSDAHTRTGQRKHTDAVPIIRFAPLLIVLATRIPTRSITHPHNVGSGYAHCSSSCFYSRGSDLGG